MTHRLHRILAAFGCTTALLLGAAAPAHATVIVGTFDPAFGGGFTNIGWRGSVTLSVPDTCLSQRNGVVVTSIDDACKDSAILNSEIDLYEFNKPASFVNINFGASPTLTHLDIAQGELLGFSTFSCFECMSYKRPPAVGLPLNMAPGYDKFSYGLSFSLTTPKVQLLAAIYAVDVSLDVEPFLFQDASADPGFQKGALLQNCQQNFGDGGIFYECSSTNAPDLILRKFDEVPEPAAPLLMGSALLAAAVTRRRQQRSVRASAEAVRMSKSSSD